ncbi:type IV pilus biogenesis/stability protein PilW [Methylotenera sp.]|uniref:type IV pilus biogenesis/stability protein PilW n=1 Tax=Methylotenera sp. TaxID=2051956 RepID=UPI002734F555|nr:type IV pilus biogenesis/stability protein PilW [Methylotenera sp.]MDP3306875.1 type IV pilus biogenesis/stability protein PilW [Methylotenera sp.]
MKFNKHLNASKISLVLMLCIIGLISTGCVNQQQQERDAENLKARARAHTDLGAVYFQQKKLEIALEEFTLAAKIDPNFSSAYNGLGLVNAQLGRDDVADANFRKAIQLDSENSEVRNNYGSFLCSRNRIDESITEFLAAVKNPLYATPAMAYTNAAICSMRGNKMANAETYLQKALQIEPLSQGAAYQLASIQFKRNDAVAAKKTLQNVMLSRPSPEVLWLAIQIERAVGARDAEASYALELRRQYPDSEQARLLQSENYQ